jgi:hypothetical protein
MAGIGDAEIALPAKPARREKASSSLSLYLFSRSMIIASATLSCQR